MFVLHRIALAVAAVAALFVLAAPAASADPAVVQRIQFAPGTSAAVVDGAVARGTTNIYLLEAAAGQSMSVSIGSAEGNAVFAVYAPDGALLFSERIDATLTLPFSGDYVIEVGTTRGSATFSLYAAVY